MTRIHIGLRADPWMLRPSGAPGGDFVTDVIALLGAKLRAFWLYDDPAHLWQDTSGTTAVTIDTDPVGRVDDLSGNGKHALQATSGNRPAYRTGPARLVFDGVNDTLSVASAAFPVDEFELFSVFEELSHPGNNRGIHGFSSTAGNEWTVADGLSIHLNDDSAGARIEGQSGFGATWSGTASTLLDLGLREFSVIGTTAYIYNNGSLMASTGGLTPRSSPHSGPFLIGSRAQTNGVLYNPANVDMRCEIMCAPLTSGERNDLRDLINGRYSLW